MVSNPPSVPAAVLPKRILWACLGVSAIACVLVVWSSGASLHKGVAWVGLILLYPTLAISLCNAWCLAKGKPVAVRIYNDEERTRPSSDWWSTISPASFALLVALMMFASKS